MPFSSLLDHSPFLPLPPAGQRLWNNSVIRGLILDNFSLRRTPPTLNDGPTYQLDCLTLNQATFEDVASRLYRSIDLGELKVWLKKVIPHDSEYAWVLDETPTLATLWWFNQVEDNRALFYNHMVTTVRLEKPLAGDVASLNHLIDQHPQLSKLVTGDVTWHVDPSEAPHHKTLSVSLVRGLQRLPKTRDVFNDWLEKSLIHHPRDFRLKTLVLTTPPATLAQDSLRMGRYLRGWLTLPSSISTAHLTSVHAPGLALTRYFAQDIATSLPQLLSLDITIGGDVTAKWLEGFARALPNVEHLHLRYLCDVDNFDDVCWSLTLDQATHILTTDMPHLRSLGLPLALDADPSLSRWTAPFVISRQACAYPKITSFNLSVGMAVSYLYHLEMMDIAVELMRMFGPEAR